jgi:hypothetical protein
MLVGQPQNFREGSVGRLLAPVAERLEYEEQGLCFGRSAGSSVGNSSISPMKRGASRVRSVAATRTAARGRPSVWLNAATMECSSMTVYWCIEPGGDLVRCALPLTHVVDSL